MQRAAVPGADQGPAEQPRGRRRRSTARSAPRSRSSCSRTRPSATRSSRASSWRRKAREASRAAAQAVSRKTAVSHRLNLPGKLADCSSTDPERERAVHRRGRLAPAARPSRAATASTQAILPLRGKVLNAEQASTQKVLGNKELQDIVSRARLRHRRRLRRSSRLRYGKIILLMDADTDGHHIATLLLTFFYRHLRQLIADGPRLPRAAAAVPDRPRQGDATGRSTSRTATASSRKLPKNAQARHHPLQGPRRDAARGAEDDDARPRHAPPAARDRSTTPLETDRVINDLMGKDVEARFKFIMERAAQADLDL